MRPPRLADRRHLCTEPMCLSITVMLSRKHEFAGSQLTSQIKAVGHAAAGQQPNAALLISKQSALKTSYTRSCKGPQGHLSTAFPEGVPEGSQSVQGLVAPSIRTGRLPYIKPSSCHRDDRHACKASTPSPQKERPPCRTRGQG